MQPELWSLYGSMLKSRLFEEAIACLWHEGRISGEMHLGTGEEGIIAGVVDHLRDDDAMTLDHRGSAALLMRGVDPVLILRELLGRPDGLCGGMGGHMHLFSKEHLLPRLELSEQLARPQPDSHWLVRSCVRIQLLWPSSEKVQ